MAEKFECVVAEYANYEKAKVALQVLDMRGFDEDAVSVICRHEDWGQAIQTDGGDNAHSAKLLQSIEQSRREKESQPSKAASGGTGAAIAGAAAAPLAVGTMLTPLFFVGPIVAAVAGAATGTMVGATQQWGIDEQAARSYHERVNAGSVIVIVHATDDDLLEAHAGLKTTDTLTLVKFKAH